MSRIDTEPLDDITEHCEKCNYIEEYENGEMTLEKLRWRCAHCRLGSNGIYKADAIVTALRLHKRIKAPYRGGRKSKITANVRETIKKQRKEGELSLRKIAKNTGYSKDTVRSVLNDDKKE